MLGFFNKLKEFNAFKRSKKSATMSGALVFFMLLGLVPTAYLLSLLFTFFGKELSFALDLLTIEEFNGVKAFILQATNNFSNGRNALAGVLAVYSSANLFVHVKLVGEVIYNYKSQKTFTLRALSIIGTVVLSLITVLGLSVYALVSIWIKKILGGVLGGAVSLVALAFIFYLIVLYINLFCCPYKLNVKEVTVGSLYSCVLAVVYTLVFILYVKYFSSYTEIYGKIAVIPAFFTWLFVLMRCLVTGFLINAFMLGKVKRQSKNLDFKPLI